MHFFIISNTFVSNGIFLSIVFFTVYIRDEMIAHCGHMSSI